MSPSDTFYTSKQRGRFERRDRPSCIRHLPNDRSLPAQGGGLGGGRGLLDGALLPSSLSRIAKRSTGETLCYSALDSAAAWHGSGGGQTHNKRLRKGEEGRNGRGRYRQNIRPRSQRRREFSGRPCDPAGRAPSPAALARSVGVRHQPHRVRAGRSRCALWGSRCPRGGHERVGSGGTWRKCGLIGCFGVSSRSAIISPKL